MRNFVFVVVVVLLLVTGGCSTSEKLGRTGVYDPGNRIDFRALRVGQESRYVGWEGAGYSGEAPVSLTYTTDTLILRVVGISDSGAVIEETLTSWKRDDYWRRDSVQRYRLQVVDDSLKYIGREQGAKSRLVWNPVFNWKLGRKRGDYWLALPLDVVDSTIVDFRGWVPLQMNCDRTCTGFVWYHEQLGRSYFRLSALVDNTAMGIDGPGIFILYSRDAGIVRDVVSSSGMWGNPTSWGWDLL